MVQQLQPGTNFGQVRKLLREFVGISLSYPAHERMRQREASLVPVVERWTTRRAMWRASPAWTYLTDVRRLPSVVVIAAIRREQVKMGPHASAWFAHRDHKGRLTCSEIRGPDYRGFSMGGDKTVSVARCPHRLTAARNPVDRHESPIGVMSLVLPSSGLALTPSISVRPAAWDRTRWRRWTSSSALSPTIHAP